MGDVVTFFEFPNEYGLKETLVQVGSVCENMEVSDFTAAKLGDTSPAVLITAYLPDPERWESGFRRRRK